MSVEINESKFKKILRENLETINSSTAHAFHNIISNRHYAVKLMWIVCLLGSAGFCGKSIFDCITQYLQYPVVSQLSVNYLNEMKFPIVKICKLDPLYGINYDSAYHIKLTYLKSFLISCKFGGNDCDMEADFDFYLDPNLGACYRFNSGNMMNGTRVPFKVTRTTGRPIGLVNSKGDGLTLKLYATSPSNELRVSESGYNILLSNESESSFNAQGVKVAAGFSTDIVAEFQTTTLQPTPYSECIDGLTTVDAYDSDVYKRTFIVSSKYQRSYHQSDCITLCYKKFIGDTCNVQLESLFYGDPYYEDMNVYVFGIDDNNPIAKCAWPEFSWPIFTKSTSFIDDCNCPMECSNSEYSVTTSISKYPTDQEIFISKFADNEIFQTFFPGQTAFTYDDLKEKVLKVEIYFDELKETVVSNDIKIMPFDLLGMIGGVLGLFLGMSFLTFVEVFEIILQTILIACEGALSSSLSKKLKKKSNVETLA